jgi:hydroxymethylglutaryl-CoA reductase (NADPH)
MAAITAGRPVRTPRGREDGYTRAAGARRAEFVRERTGVSLEPMSSYSFDPAITTGNIEHFIGVAQVRIGLAGPLRVNGEHARGEFYLAMATAEETLMASCNRGRRLLYEAGGVTTTVMHDHMQRAPSFLSPSAREARAFGQWLRERFEDIKAAAETTTGSGRLAETGQYSPSRMLFTRFNYITADAAGAEADRQGDAGGVPVDRRAPPARRAKSGANHHRPRAGLGGMNRAGAYPRVLRRTN